MHPFFGSRMVLQHSAPVCLRGWGQSEHLKVKIQMENASGYLEVWCALGPI